MSYLNHSACHTWLYKHIDAITKDELIRFINYAINERSNRTYMQCSPKEFALKLKKTANTSWGQEEVEKYIDINEGISRFDKAVELNKQWIKTLQTAKDSLDFSILRNTSLFEYHPIFKDYIYLDMDQPFKYCGYTHALYKNKEDIIKFLWKNNTGYNKQYIVYNDICGMSEEIENQINQLFDIHGNTNLLIEFAP